MPSPLVLFTYNRPEHTRATLEALERNTLAGQTDLVVYSDGPKREVDVGAIEAVRDLVRSASGFASITLVERPINLGLARSVIAGVTQVLERHDSVIVLEDDLVTSQHFLEYMNASLAYYRDDPLAFSVTGHTYSSDYLSIPEDYPYDTYAGYRCSSWSWGTWPDRWQRVDWEMRYFGSFRRDPVAQAEFDRGGQDMTTLLRMQHEGKLDSWAIRFCYAHHASGMRCIYPTRTLVRNIGLDNSGTHSKPQPRFSHTGLDQSWVPQRFCPAGEIDARIALSFRSVFDPPPPSKLRLLARKAKHLARAVMQRARTQLRRATRHPRDVDVLVVNTFQKFGGAARAANRIFRGIKSKYPRAHYLTLLREDRGADISGRYEGSVKGLLAGRLASLDTLPLRRYPNRLPLPFTPALRANPLRVPLASFNAKLVHLNWVGTSLLRIEELARLNVPVVWTLHDAWPFTGGCHYTGDCERFKQQCGNCPQLASAVEDDLSRALWRRKQRAFARMDLTVVAPSRWLAQLARQSSLLLGRRVEVIPNGLDTDVFKPVDKNAAKAYFGVDPAHPVLLFGARWLTDRRKGGDLLRDAIARLDFPCTLLVFGEGDPLLPATALVAVRVLGNLSDDISLALVYSAADVFVCPSREDNLPNTVAEALACGTPCAAFDVNGLPDMIEHMRTGWLAKPFDAGDLAAGIKWLATHPQPEQLRRAARDKALKDYGMAVMVQRYASLYAELLGTGAR
jgi:glycosyltransferase involved in cell wall biosynthesis